MGKMYTVIDRSRLLALVTVARKTGNNHSEELGTLLYDLCMKVMNTQFGELSFSGYSEDWKAEMVGNAMIALFNAIGNSARLDSGDALFNYMFTIVRNSYRRTLDRLYNKPEVAAFEHGGDRDMVETVSDAERFNCFYVKNKRRMMRGLLDKNRERIIEAARTRKKALLKNVIRSAVKNFVGVFTRSQLKELLKIARKNREATC